MAIARPSRLIVFALAAVLFAAAVPSTAEAQRRYRRPSRVVFIGAFGYYPYWAATPWQRWGPYGYAYDIRRLVAELRIDVEPTDAQVFVDGYYAGVVDDFDGIFQRLRLEPGGRTITIFREGYRTEERRLYLSPGTDQRVRFHLQPLGPGERSLPPQPGAEPYDEDVDPAAVPEGAFRRPGARLAPAEPPARQAPVRFGTLALRKRPADAEVFVDGERWETDGGEAVTIRLPEGRHRVEVRRQGLPSFTQDVLIRRGRTLTLNVALE